jgi:Putative prokaryotic signal transducing protein
LLFGELLLNRKETMSDVITIASFTEPMEAEMARLRLQSAGIETFLSGENARILEPGLGPLQLQVAGEDEADARAILADPGTDVPIDSGPATPESV